MDFAHIGVMASLNIVSVLVYEKPRVAILSTGSELLELGEIQTNSSQIRSSNNYIFRSLLVKKLWRRTLYRFGMYWVID